MLSPLCCEARQALQQTRGSGQPAQATLITVALLQGQHTCVLWVQACQTISGTLFVGVGAQPRCDSHCQSRHIPGKHKAQGCRLCGSSVVLQNPDPPQACRILRSALARTTLGSRSGALMIQCWLESFGLCTQVAQSQKQPGRRSQRFKHKAPAAGVQSYLMHPRNIRCQL